VATGVADGCGLGGWVCATVTWPAKANASKRAKLLMEDIAVSNYRPLDSMAMELDWVQPYARSTCGFDS